jgi:hypothetical protein
MAGNRVHYSTDCVATVEQRSRTFDDLNTFYSQDIYGLRVITRLESQTANAIPIL